MKKVLLFCAICAFTVPAAKAQDFLNRNQNQNKNQNQNPGYGSYFGDQNNGGNQNNTYNQNNQERPSFFNFGQQQEEEEKPVLNQYSSKYKKDPSAIEGKSKKLLPQADFRMSLVRTDKTAPDEVMIRLLSPVTVNGCLSVEQPTLETMRNGAMIWYTVTPPDVMLTNGVRHPEYECPQGAQFGILDIPLKRDELIKKRIKTIAFKTAHLTDYYDVSVDEDQLTLTGRSALAFKPATIAERSNALSFRFLPPNTVVLHAPGEDKSFDVRRAVSVAARAKGLTEAGETLSDFADREQSGNGVFYIDEENSLAPDLSYGESVLFQSVEVADAYQGSRGGYTKPKTVDIYIRKPGALD